MADTSIVLEPDPVIEAYKKDIDRTLLRENLKLTPEERLRKLQSAVDSIVTLREALTQAPGRAAELPAGKGWQDLLIETLGSGVDETLVIESLRMSPTERLETMRRAALGIEAMQRR